MPLCILVAFCALVSCVFFLMTLYASDCCVPVYLCCFLCAPIRSFLKIVVCVLGGHAGHEREPKLRQPLHVEARLGRHAAPGQEPPLCGEDVHALY